ncbi:hypothetical protein MHPYR_610010 [uncultured Mycobacterium sp.]|uniref:Uncharacterized protein n=1 Tax=uncultured Mycobacterium sp. TaxID=171292 RepID=A0A1Y5PN23_9MYCO|nr:hypothetical protein [Mycolicibacterium aromaticivorans]SBS78790.1 hypothetical protein MHPYR_610010 [uncultured Mycobacterium sp.]
MISGADSVSGPGIGDSNTEGPLAAMLYSAAITGEGMDWVLLAVGNMESDDDKVPTKLGRQMAATAVRVNLR